MAVLAPAFWAIGSGGLRSLDLGENFIGDLGAAALAGVWAHLTRLTELRLPWSRLHARGVLSLAPLFPQLAHLNLDSNKLNSGSAAELAKCGSGMTALASLSLSQNALGPAEAESLLRPLLANASSLTDLNLGGNTIGANGLVRVAPYLSAAIRQGSLASLDLSDNGINYGPMRVRGKQSLLEALCSLSGLRRLHAFGNTMGADLWEELMKVDFGSIQVLEVD